MHLDGRVGAVQVLSNYILNDGNIIEPVSGDNLYSWSSAPKLNGLYLYSFLSSKNICVDLIHNFMNEKKRFADLLGKKPKAVIISTSFIFFKKNLRRLAAEIRTIAPDIYIIAGGAFVYYSYLLYGRSREDNYPTEQAADDFLFLRTDNEPKIDLYIASPRGEHSLYNALRLLKKGASLESLADSVFFNGKSYVFGSRKEDVLQNQASYPDWNTLPQTFFEKGVIPVQASNGCPYNCSFCNFTKDRRLTYVKPVDQLVDELKCVEEKGIKYVWFVDDNFRLGKSDINDVCRQFVENGISVKWMCFIRAGTLRNADLALLKQAGCIEVQIGLESGDPQILHNMNKQADPAMYSEVIGQVLEHGINVSCYFISGFPGETEQTAEVTRNFIQSIENPDAKGYLSWSIYPFLLTPLSPIYEPAMRQKYELRGYLNNWSHRTMNFAQAKKLVGRAFMELENSGPIYREDNLELLARMPSDKKRNFFNTRHSLAKKAMRGHLSKEEIIDALRDIL